MRYAESTTFIADERCSEGIEFSGRTDSLNQRQRTVYELRDGCPSDAPSSFDTKSGTVYAVTVQGKNFVNEGTETNDASGNPHGHGLAQMESPCHK